MGTLDSGSSMILLGAAGGDIAGSRFEWNNHRSKDFELFSDKCDFTDDTVMTMAVAQVFADTDISPDQVPDDVVRKKAQDEMLRFGRHYPGRGYGGGFSRWLHSGNPRPYNSYGNGSAMRVSACGWAGNSPCEVARLATLVSEPTHNHPEGIKGAVATAQAVFYARTGWTKDAIRSAMEKYYNLDFTLDEIRPTYKFNETCQGTVPQAIVAFLESTSYEDALRCAISIGGDSDTMGAITGAVAEAFYGIPEDMQKTILSYLSDGNDTTMLTTLRMFNEKYNPKEGIAGKVQ